MNININKEIKVIITLNEEEAIWLKNSMQNPCMQTTYNNTFETVENQINRENLFNNLNNSLISKKD